MWTANHNTQEVKKERFLISTRKNNVHIFSFPNSVVEREEAQSVSTAIFNSDVSSATCLRPFVFYNYLFVRLSLWERQCHYAENSHIILSCRY